MASRKLLAPRTAVYQDGRGSEPMIDVGRVFPADALNIFLRSFSIAARRAEYERAFHGSTSAASRTIERGSCWQHRKLAYLPGPRRDFFMTTVGRKPSGQINAAGIYAHFT